MQNNEGLRDAIVEAIAGVAEGNSKAMGQLQQTLAAGTQLTAEQQQRLEQGVAELAQKMNQAANQKKKVRIIYDEEGDPIGAEQVEEDDE
jgi:enoyl-[acyl-carrier-protein] reductase (NADH)